jgi:hypothetical protein
VDRSAGRARRRALGTEIRLYSLAKDDGVDHTGERGYAQRVR